MAPPKADGRDGSEPRNRRPCCALASPAPLPSYGLSEGPPAPLSVSPLISACWLCAWAASVNCVFSNSGSVSKDSQTLISRINVLPEFWSSVFSLRKHLLTICAGQALPRALDQEIHGGPRGPPSQRFQLPVRHQLAAGACLIPAHLGASSRPSHLPADFLPAPVPILCCSLSQPLAAHLP